MPRGRYRASSDAFGAQCLFELDRVTDSKYNRAAIELGIWYHDVVYDPASNKNEQASADKLLSDLGGLATDLDLSKIVEMILATKHDNHRAAYEMDTELLLDIDLSILGRCRFDYHLYQRRIREEYQHVPWPIFTCRRKRLLKGFLQRDIYRTSEMREKYEGRARENIKSELRQWRNRVIPCF